MTAVRGRCFVALDESHSVRRAWPRISFALHHVIVDSARARAQFARLSHDGAHNPCAWFTQWALHNNRKEHVRCTRDGNGLPLLDRALASAHAGGVDRQGNAAQGGQGPRQIALTRVAAALLRLQLPGAANASARRGCDAHAAADVISEASGAHTVLPKLSDTEMRLPSGWCGGVESPRR